MAESGWVRHAFAIGIFEFRRSVRALWNDKARFGMIAFGLAFPAILITGGIVLFADAISEIGAIPLSNDIRGTIGLFWLFGVFLIGMRTASARTHIEAEPLMLTSVSARTVAGGLVVAETLRVLTYLSLYTR